MCERGECDFVTDIATPLPMMLIGELLGFPNEDYQKLLHWSDLFATGLNDMPEGFLEKVGAAVREWNEYVTFYFEKRRAEPGDDLISAIVNAKINGVGLTHTELMHEAMLILVGGDETTRHVISGGMEALLRRPEQYALLLAQPHLLDSAIEEMLRWVTPVKNMNRTATRDTELWANRSVKATNCCCCTNPAIATKRSSTAPISSTSAAIRTTTCRLADTAVTSASARTSHVSRSA